MSDRTLTPESTGDHKLSRSSTQSSLTINGPVSEKSGKHSPQYSPSAHPRYAQVYSPPKRPSNFARGEIPYIETEFSKTPRQFRVGRFNETPILLPGVMSVGMSPARHRIIQMGRRDTLASSGMFSLFKGDDEKPEQLALPQILRSHNIASITLCSVFGTGLLVRTATTLEQSGPLPLIAAFVAFGLFCYQVLLALCEMCSYIPLPNAYSGYTERFVDPALGYAVGYCYLFQYIIIGPSEIFAGALALEYWVPGSRISPAVWVSIFLIVLLALNYLDVGKIAIAGDVFVLTKIIVYFIIIVLMLVIVVGGTPKHETIGFKYWKDPGVVNTTFFAALSPSANSAAAFILAITTSVFAFTGVESFCVTVSEARYPRKTIPKAKNIIFFVVTVCYMPIVILIALCVAYNDKKLNEAVKNADKGLTASLAIVVAVQNAGLSFFPSFLNAAIFIFVLSAANSAIYVSTRILYGLSACGLAPAVFSKTNKGIPLYSLAIIMVLNLLSYLGVNESSRELFTLFSNSVMGFLLILWACILVTHLRFLRAMKVQSLELNRTTYKAKGGYTASCFALAFAMFLIVFREFPVFMDTSNFDWKSFVTGYVSIPVVCILWLAFRLYYGTSFVKASEADLLFYKDCVDRNEEQCVSEELEMLAKKRHMGFLKRCYYKFLF